MTVGGNRKIKDLKIKLETSHKITKTQEETQEICIRKKVTHAVSQVSQKGQKNKNRRIKIF